MTERIGPLDWNVMFRRVCGVHVHVLAFAFDGRCWIVVDPHLGFTETYTLAPGPQFDAWLAEESVGAETWLISGRREACCWPGLFCTSVIARLVGLRSGAFSPGGLRRDLVRAGARQVFSREGQGPEGRPGRESSARAGTGTG